MGRQSIRLPGVLDTVLEVPVEPPKVHPAPVVGHLRGDLQVVVGIDEEEILVMDEVLPDHQLHEWIPLITQAQGMVLGAALVPSPGAFEGSEHFLEGARALDGSG